MSEVNQVTFSISDIMALLAVIAALYAFIKMIKEIKKPMQDRNAKIDELLKNHEEKINSDFEKLNAISEVLTNISKKLDNTDQKIDRMSECFRDFARQILLNECSKCIEQKFATLEQKETIDRLYKSYSALGGNSFITTHVKQVVELPSKLDKQVLNE
jgi:cysteinyl-tRNA synthetase